MTAQVPDSLVIDGVPANLRCCPELPHHHPRLRDSTEAEDAAAARTHHILHSTACWRRYIADWRIDDGRLSLTGITGRYRLDGDEPLFADWVSEPLQIAEGRRLLYVHMGFGSVYERDVFLDVRAGVVVGRQVVDNRERPLDEAERARLSREHIARVETGKPVRRG